MKIVIEIDDNVYDLVKQFEKGLEFIDKQNDTVDTALMRAIINGTPLPEHLNKIKDDIGKYELDCRFADYSQTDECTICNKNVFGSIYRIIDKYIEGSESE